MSRAGTMIDVVEPDLQMLHRYWLDHCNGNALPSRAALGRLPITLPHLLPNLILVDTAAHIEDFRYRLFGSAVCQGFGHDRTGVALGTLREGVDNYDQIYAGYWQTYDEARPDYFHGRIVSLAQDYKRYSRLLLPLSSDGKRVETILGGMMFFRRNQDRPTPAPA